MFAWWKKAPFAYLVFSNEKRADFTKELGGATSPGPLAKLTAEKWATLSDDQKKPFVEKTASAEPSISHCSQGKRNVARECCVPRLYSWIEGITRIDHLLGRNDTFI